MILFGIDVGGSGIKGAPVDTQTGEFLPHLTARTRIVPAQMYGKTRAGVRVR